MLRNFLAILPITFASFLAFAETSAELIEKSAPADWRTPDPARTVYLELATGGRVVMELAPAPFAPQHVANLKALIAAGYFDGLAILRSQDNYVVQWGDPETEKNPTKAKPIPPKAKRNLPAEFDAPAPSKLQKLPDPDTYAPEVGFIDGFPTARDPEKGRAWLIHCYGMVGAGRDDAADSGGGTELYVVSGHAPRHLDRNVTLVGRVIWGMDHLSTLPRGTGAMGFYEKPEQRVLIKSVKLASTVPPKDRVPLELLRTDTPLFGKFIEARRHRREKWFIDAVGRLEVCNVPLPVRLKKP